MAKTLANARHAPGAHRLGAGDRGQDLDQRGAHRAKPFVADALRELVGAREAAA